MQIEISDYDPTWPERYRREEEGIRAALHNRVVLIEHAGSTSVPGLAAKPIIDIVLEVADSTDEASYLPDLEAAGFVLRVREPEWHEHRMLKGPEGDVNLHVFSAGCSETRRTLLFRDWLRTHEDDRDLYERVKRELATRTDWREVQEYADAKTTVIEEILARVRR